MKNLGSEILVTESDPKLVLGQIEQIVKEHPVVLFVKGDSVMPQCGFSARVIQVMNLCGTAFKTVDVLKNPSVREQIKLFTDWPTLPQVYIKGEFIGGSDIVTELYQTGKMQEKLKDVTVGA